MHYNQCDSHACIPDCITAEEKRIAALDDEYIGMLSEFILCSRPSTKTEIQKELQPYW